MCGICGIYSINHRVPTDCIQKMTEVIRHRGPDDEGYLAGFYVTQLASGLGYPAGGLEIAYLSFEGAVLLFQCGKFALHPAHVPSLGTA